MSKKKLSIGDRVTIYRNCPSHHAWIDYMRDLIGKSGEIIDVAKNSFGVVINHNLWYVSKASVKREVKKGESVRTN